MLITKPTLFKKYAYVINQNICLGNNIHITYNATASK